MVVHQLNYVRIVNSQTILNILSAAVLFRDLRFDQGGIMVINVQACKGLEFDDVVLADIDQHNFWSNDMDAIRKRFYVMVARARENVFMFMRQGSFSRVEEILPDDETILRREEEKKPDSFMEEDGDIPF